MRNQKGEAERVLGIAQNITERKKSDEALRHSEEHLRLIMESAIDYAIITMDTDRKITGWNSGAEKLLGYREEEILGQSGDIIFVERDRKENAPEKETEKR